eukprot:Gregarina_sp_Pseudo_9__280@NODE_117_length_4172_cov_53_977982_g109_i0_p1_GENE_NODE_117_length_4172_cov_53_977982_g109_i0NODE_117_length_4172_cov_53_977982_g109_i0_p1_ORF_typecomplete_len449_score62_56zfCCCH/PF00642_24/0_0031zfCCCH/PF00642_24/9_5zfCCCH/PF00642_24/2_6e05Torus/PF16131_5/5_7e05Torus/PF16131_5/7_2e02Torus/PF16131_5/0_026zfCCCH_3/PF15663_5/0_00019zfCCCH_3/PF15663_5/0_0025Mito_fiss_reg/PF05308_11/0_12Mito_fiss_reg/PF05308_11/1_1zfCCCH_4/PF18044_1/2zfCCCH_4/PF18044_1/2_7e03zfCCCH_4/PF18
MTSSRVAHPSVSSLPPILPLSRPPLPPPPPPPPPPSTMRRFSGEPPSPVAPAFGRVNSRQSLQSQDLLRRQRRSTSCSAGSASVSTRSPQFYKTRMCPWFFKQCCDLGAKCRFAHSVEELRRPPDLSRTSLCPRLLKQGVCNTVNCSYAHNHKELRATDEFFKVSLCYMWQKGRCALGSKCRHAHGMEELRTKAAAAAELAMPSYVMAPPPPPPPPQVNFSTEDLLQSSPPRGFLEAFPGVEGNDFFMRAEPDAGCVAPSFTAECFCLGDNAFGEAQETASTLTSAATPAALENPRGGNADYATLLLLSAASALLNNSADRSDAGVSPVMRTSPVASPNLDCVSPSVRDLLSSNLAVSGSTAASTVFPTAAYAKEAGLSPQSSALDESSLISDLMSFSLGALNARDAEQQAAALKDFALSEVLPNLMRTPGCDVALSPSVEASALKYT